MSSRAGSTLTGAGSGALAGGMLGGPVGAGIGGLLGGAVGFFGSQSTDDSANAQRAALDAAMQRLQAFSTQDAAKRANDLQKTMAFYGPADAYLKSIYAQPAPAAPGGAIPPIKPGIPQGPRLPMG